MKEKIHAQKRIAPEYQRLIFSGRQLEDTRTLKDYKNVFESKLSRLKGGDHNFTELKQEIL